MTMDNGQSCSGATYRIVRRMDRTYGVELKLPGALPTLVTSFKAREAAIEWIEGHQGQLENRILFSGPRSAPGSAKS